MPILGLNALLLLAITAGAVDLGIRSDGTNVTVWATNAPRFSLMQYSRDLTNWQDHSRYDCYVCTNTFPLWEFSTKATGDRTFWRIQNCE